MDDRYFTGEQNAEARLSKIAYLLQAGKKVQAIKLYREYTGSGLTYAKDVVEQIEREMRSQGF
ncbi:MAG TPA: ribosomal protein L7/L12 [Ktedonobacteraceae bacterium]